MSYNILTETDFFKVVENTEGNPEIGKMQEADSIGESVPL